MDLAQMKAAVTMEGVLSGAAALELIAEVERGKTEIVRMAKEWLQEPEPDNGTVGELDVDEITVMIAGLVDKVESLTALCDGYRGEIGTAKVEAASAWQDGVRAAASRADGIKVGYSHMSGFHAYTYDVGSTLLSLLDSRPVPQSALIRARAEGMEEAVGIISGILAEVHGYGVTRALTRACAAIRERATKGDSDEG